MSFPVVNFVVHHGIEKVANGGGCGNGVIFFGQFLGFILADFTGDIGDSLVKLCRKVSALIRYAGGFETEATRYHFHFARHHFRALDKVGIHHDAVLGGVKLHPFRHNVDYPVSLLEYEDVQHDIRSGVALEDVVG